LQYYELGEAKNIERRVLKLEMGMERNIEDGVNFKRKK
jgi:hypothetical protein